MRKARNPKNQVRTLSVTRKDYDRERASGTPPEDALKPGKYHFRRATRFAKPEDLEKRNAKLTVSIRLDSDIVEFFKKRAAAPHAAPYQTQINTELRKVMEGRTSTAIHQLVRDETFIAAIAARVRQLV